MAQTVLVNLDLGRNEIQNVRLQALALAPASPVEALIYYDTTLDKVGVYTGTAWEYLGPSNAGGGDADTLNGQAGTYYLSRANHTGSQAISTITGLQATLDGKAASTHVHGSADITDFNSAVDARVALVVDAAPAALDTLNELAAALGDDANFAATVNTALAARTRKYAQSIGDGSATSFVITHSLNTDDVTVQIRYASGTKAYVIADIEATSVNTVTVRFATAPTSNQFRVIIVG